MKSKERLAKEYSDLIDRSEDGLVEQCFIAGFEAGAPKWINVNEQTPEDERSVIIKTFDYRRPKENITCTTLGYFENGIWLYEDGGGVVDEGNGWHIIQWMEIPQ